LGVFWAYSISVSHLHITINFKDTCNTNYFSWVLPLCKSFILTGVKENNSDALGLLPGLIGKHRIDENVLFPRTFSMLFCTSYSTSCTSRKKI